MAQEIKIPTAEDFRKKVQEMEEKYGIVDCIYIKCTEEFSHLKLGEVNELHETRIIEPFLFQWGQMQRRLGHNGLKKVCKKIKEKSFADRVEPLRNKSLNIVNMEEFKGLAVSLFDEIAQIKIEYESTVASKVLHLCCPDLFMMWDANIRKGYKKKNGDGKDYFQFLIEMQKLWMVLDETIKDLQKRYGKKSTRIIDEYNWCEFHKEE